MHEKKKSLVRYRCERCEVNFATGLYSMYLHMEAHSKGKVIKIYKTKNNNYRPQQHSYNKHTRKMYQGGLCKLVRISLPEDVEIKENRIYCRGCSKISFHYGSASLRSRCKIIDLWSAHERRCAGFLPKPKAKVPTQEDSQKEEGELSV